MEFNPFLKFITNFFYAYQLVIIFILFIDFNVIFIFHQVTLCGANFANVVNSILRSIMTHRTIEK